MTAASEPVAIVGLSCAIPSDVPNETLDFQAFGHFLDRGGCSIGDIPAERFCTQGRLGNKPGQASTSRASLLPEFDTFDHRAFNLSASEARQMTAQMRKLIEISFDALQDSGLDARGSGMGVFVGASQAMQKQRHAPRFQADEYFQTGQVNCMLANRISYLFDLQGPSFSVDTACSASLTAIHLALQSLASGDCDSALVASANHLARLEELVGFSQLGVLSPTGTCRALADGADGYVRGEAVAAVVLKPLSKALQDGDNVYATILGSAINSNGAQAAGLTSPCSVQLSKCIERAWHRANRDPRKADYLEMHATGTVVGDRMEGETLRTFAHKKPGQPSRQSSLVVGSVKSNVGHTEFTAFLVSLLKVVHIVRRRRSFPQILVEHRNRQIPWSEIDVEIARGEKLGIDDAQPLLSGISSSGFGGSNGHIVVQSPPSLKARNNSLEGNLHLFVASALSKKAIDEAWSCIAKQANHLPAAPLAYTLARRARTLPWRSYGIGTSVSDAMKSASSVQVVSSNPLPPPAPIFLFPGQGPQHLHMARSLYQRFNVFRTSIDRADAVYQRVTMRLTGRSISLTTTLGLFDGCQGVLWDKDAVWSPLYTLPALAAVQIGLVDLFRSWTIMPCAVIAHSAGETAMAYASGAFGNQDWHRAQAVAVELSILRGAAMAKTEKEQAGMLAVQCSLRQAYVILRSCAVEVHDDIEVAAINTQNALTLAGKRASLAQYADVARQNGIASTFLRTSVAPHTRYMEPLRDDFCSQVEQLFADHALPSNSLIAREDVLVFSSTTGGTPYRGAFDTAFWWRNLREVVRFDEASRLISLHASHSSILEISPHPVLGPLLQSAKVCQAAIIPTLQRPRNPKDCQACEESDIRTLFSAIGTLLCSGHPVCLPHFFDQSSSGVFSTSQVPSAPLAKTHLAVQVSRHDVDSSKALRGPMDASAGGIYVSGETHPDLFQHCISDVPCMPATGYVAIVLESFGQAGIHIYDLEIKTAMSIPKGGLPTHITLNSDADGRFDIASDVCTGHDKFEKTLHATGWAVRDTVKGQTPSKLNVDDVLSRCPLSVSDHELDVLLNNVLPDMGPNFRRASNLRLGDGEALADVRLTPCSQDTAYMFDPAVLDALLHLLVPIVFHPIDGSVNEVYLPASVAYADLSNAALLNATVEAKVHTRLTEWSPDSVMADAEIVRASDGRIIATLQGVRFNRLAVRSSTEPDIRYTIEWQPDTLPQKLLWPKDQSRLGFSASHSDIYDALDHNALWHLHNACPSAVTQTDAIDRLRFQAFCVGVVKSLPRPASKVDIRAPFTAIDTVLDRVGAILPSALHDDQAGINALFNDDAMTALYEVFGAMDGAFDRGIECLFAAARHALASGKRVLRILEAGAGTGQFSKVYAKAWAHRPDDIADIQAVFVVTDVSISFAKQSAEAMGSSLAVSSDVLDLAQDIGTQRRYGTQELGSFDAILMWNVLHVVPEVQPAIQRLHNLLVPGGYLVVLDLDGDKMSRREPGYLFTNLLMGVFKDWYGFTDDRRQHCTMGERQWRSKLSKAGFDSSAVQVGRQEERNISHIVIAAQKSSDVKAYQALEPECTYQRFAFKQGCEFDLAQWIVKMDARRDGVTLVVTLVKEDASATGIVRSARREYADRKIRTVIFDADDCHDDAALHRILNVTSELEIRVTADGSILVPRMVRVTKEAASLRSDKVRSHPQVTESAQDNAWSFPGTLPPTPPSSTMTGSPSIGSTMPFLLDSHCAYFIVGGCSSLGLRLASWMYGHGAHHIVCTSRSGPAFLKRPSTSARHVQLARWLQSRPDLHIDFVAVDVSDSAAMSDLFSRYLLVGGAVHLPMVLDDKRLSAMRSTDDFEVCFRPKVQGLRNLIESLNPQAWVLAMSSLSSLCGNPGASNYTASNTWMEELISRRPNSCAMLMPSVSDMGWYARNTVSEAVPKIGNALTWAKLACTSDDLLAQVEDAVQLMHEARCSHDSAGGSLYIGPIALTSLLHLEPRLTTMMAHLLPRSTTGQTFLGDTAEEKAQVDPRAALRAYIAHMLDMDVDDLGGSVPIKLYGVDSIVAIRLSAGLRAQFGLEVTQLQLLTEATLDVLELQQMAALKPDGGLSASSKEECQLDKIVDRIQDPVAAALGSDSCVIAMNTLAATAKDASVACHDASTNDCPLFILHGGGVGVRPFTHWAASLPCPVYGVRETSVTAGFNSADAILEHYADEMIAAQRQHSSANRPFRIAAFCLGALWAPRLAEILRERGHSIEAMLFLDNSPALYLAKEAQRAIQSFGRRQLGAGHDTFRAILTEVAADDEPAFSVGLLEPLCQAFEAATEATPWIDEFIDAMDRQLRLAIGLLREKGCPGDQRTKVDPATLAAWLRKCLSDEQGQSIPLLMITMERGLRIAPPGIDEHDELDFGLRHVSSNVRMIRLLGSHYAAFGDAELTASSAVRPLVQATIDHFGLQVREK